MGAVGRSMIQYGAGGEERSTFGIIFAWEGSALSGCYASVIVATVIASSLYVSPIPTSVITIYHSSHSKATQCHFFLSLFCSCSGMECLTNDTSRGAVIAANMFTLPALSPGLPGLLQKVTRTSCENFASTSADCCGHIQLRNATQFGAQKRRH